MDVSLPRRLAPSGLVVATIGFVLTRFTVTVAAYEDPVRFVIAGVVSLVLGLGLSAFGVALSVGQFERTFVDTVAKWCVASAVAMTVLVVLTLVGNGTSLAMEPVRSRTYLSNFLIGGSVGGTLTATRPIDIADNSLRHESPSTQIRWRDSDARPRTAETLHLVGHRGGGDGAGLSHSLRGRQRTAGVPVPRQPATGNRLLAAGHRATVQ